MKLSPRPTNGLKRTASHMLIARCASIGQLGGSDPKLLEQLAPSLVQRLDDADWDVRATTCDVLGQLDAAILEPYEQELRRVSESDAIIAVRWQARKALAKLDDLCGRWSVDPEEDE